MKSLDMPITPSHTVPRRIALRFASGRQRGGFVLGAIIGLLVGLVLALGVAMYVTKVPVPFVERVLPHTAEQEAAEAERNRNWDPNGGLANKPTNLPPAATPTVSAPASVPAAAPAPVAAASRPPIPKPPRDPANILAGEGGVTTSTTAAASGATSTKPAAEALMYFVQTGAFTRSEEADQQRAKLAIEGFSARITEREQNGRILFRVRLGPYDKHEEADSVLEQVKLVAPPATIVRVQRAPS